MILKYLDFRIRTSLGGLVGLIPGLMLGFYLITHRLRDFYYIEHPTTLVHWLFYGWGLLIGLYGLWHLATEKTGFRDGLLVGFFGGFCWGPVFAVIVFVLNSVRNILRFSWDTHPFLTVVFVLVLGVVCRFGKDPVKVPSKN